jgi:hypothetical protein
MLLYRFNALIFLVTDPIQSQFEVIFIVIVESPKQTIFLISL